jgi:hypothetical protein
MSWPKTESSADQVVERVQSQLSALPAELEREVRGRLVEILSPPRRPQGADRVYALLGGGARVVKVLLQMLVAGVTMVFMVWGLVEKLIADRALLPVIDAQPTVHFVLGVVGVGLAVATAVELAYGLFTDGPDEIVDPIMLGLASAILIQLADAQRFDTGQAVAALLYVVALGVLFMTRKRYVRVKVPAPAWKTPRKSPRRSGDAED